MNKLLNNLNKHVSNLTNNKNLVFFVGLFVAIYGVFAAPELPEIVKSMFQNNVFKLSVILLVAYLSGAKNMKLLLFVAILFLLVTHSLSQNGLLEKYDNYRNLERFQDLSEVSEEMSEEMSEEYSEENNVEMPEESSEENDVEMPEESSEENNVEMPEESSEENNVEMPEEQIEEAFKQRKIKRKLKNILGDVKDLTTDVNRLMKKI